MTIEKLTDEERRELEDRWSGAPSVQDAYTKALRIIEQQADALADANESLKHWEQQHGVQWERAEAAGSQLAELRRLHDTDAVTCREALDLVDELQHDRDAANTLLSDAAAWFESPQHTIAHGATLCLQRIRAHLDGQAPPARTPELRPGCTTADYYEPKPTREDWFREHALQRSEKLVLDACSAVPDLELQAWTSEVATRFRRAVAEAELARRNARG